MNSDDLRDAVNYTFEQSFRWLRLSGFEKNNLPYLKRSEDIKLLTNGEYERRYENAVEIRQEALYSGKLPTQENRARMIEFYEESKTQSSGIIGVPKKIIAKLFRFM